MSKRQTPSGTVTQGVTREETKRRLAALRAGLETPTTKGNRHEK